MNDLVPDKPDVRPAGARPATHQPASGLARRRLLAALRDAHAGSLLRIAVLRDCAHLPRSIALRHIAQRMHTAAEDQCWRLDHAFATLAESPGGGLAAETEASFDELRSLLARCPPGPALDEALAGLLWRIAERDADEAALLRLAAHAEGRHLVARLLDMTALELREAAAALAPLVQRRQAAKPN